MISEYNLSNDDIKGLQLYVDCDLYLNLTKSDVKVQKNILNDQVSKTESYVNDQVKINRKTPGVAVSGGLYQIDVDFGNSIVVPFFKGSDGRYGTVYPAVAHVKGKAYTIGNRGDWGTTPYLRVNKMNLDTKYESKTNILTAPGKTRKKD
jgi:hypothetical protein